MIALLLDGPQLAARRPGRYAAVLADDPGSSVQPEDRKRGLIDVRIRDMVERPCHE